MGLDIRRIVQDLIDEYHDWVQPYVEPGEVPYARCPEAFLGCWDPERVQVLFLGINPGGQPSQFRPTVDEHLQYAAGYFRGPEVRRDKNIWERYGFFFPHSPASTGGSLTGADLFQALATRSMVTNLIHWPTKKASGRHLPARVKRVWIPRGSRHVERLLALARPNLIVVQHTDAFVWMLDRLCERPWSSAPGLESLWRGQVQPPLFRSGLRIEGLPSGYRPYILPALHLSAYPKYDWLHKLYRDVSNQVDWSNG